MPERQLISKELYERVILNSTVDLNGVHGPSHWARVLENGMKIAVKEPGVSKTVVALFALFHDCQRLNDYEDPNHGWRSVDLLKRSKHLLPPISDKNFKRLVYALKWHDAFPFPKSYYKGDKTIGACWDADRLDLPRVGIIPDPRLLNTKTGKQMAMRYWR